MVILGRSSPLMNVKNEQNPTEITPPHHYCIWFLTIYL